MFMSYTNENSSSQKVHTLSKGINKIPHTSLEPLSQTEIIVTGGDSYSFPKQKADSVIIETVSISLRV